MSKLLREKLEYMSARFTTGEGVFEFFISNFIWGFWIANDKIQGRLFRQSL